MTFVTRRREQVARSDGFFRFSQTLSMKLGVPDVE